MPDIDLDFYFGFLVYMKPFYRVNLPAPGWEVYRSHDYCVHGAKWMAVFQKVLSEFWFELAKCVVPVTFPEANGEWSFSLSCVYFLQSGQVNLYMPHLLYLSEVGVVGVNNSFCSILSGVSYFDRGVAE
jgi:hypothetical protein